MRSGDTPVTRMPAAWHPPAPHLSGSTLPDDLTPQAPPQRLGGLDVVDGDAAQARGWSRSTSTIGGGCADLVVGSPASPPTPRWWHRLLTAGLVTVMQGPAPPVGQDVDV